MPNGDPNWYKTKRPKLEEFFSRISHVLEDFAKNYNLKVEKYYHQFPSWDLVFRHPKGGIGQIEIHECDSTDVEILVSWWIDCFTTSRRDYKQGEGVKCSLDPVVLRAQLEKSFELVLSWRKENLVKGSENPYRERGVMDTREKVERELQKYPVPKLG